MSPPTITASLELSRQAADLDRSIPARAESASLRTVRSILVALGIFALLGVALALWLRSIPSGRPDASNWFNVFYVLFARHEPLGLALVAVFSFAAAFWLRTQRHEDSLPTTAHSIFARPRLIIWIALGVFAVTAAGTHVVCHDYALTADENLADFQAKIFLRGRIAAPVPEHLLPAAQALTPTFVDYFPKTHSWKSTYLPVYAAMRAVFLSVNLQSLFNPLLAAVSVLALYGTARRLWPDEREKAVLGALLLGSSSQVLIMAMTSYAMPAHLALNAIWLWLYVSPEKKRFYVAPLVGVLAIGLHQPIVHALFVTPFLFRLLLERKWRPGVAYGAIYFAGCVGWYLWKQHYTVPPEPSSDAASGIGHIFRLFNPLMLVVQPMDLLLVIGWASLATPLLAILGLRRFFKLPPLLRDAALSCLLTFGFYYFFYVDQGHGWGYRYFHGALGCFVLLAIAGWDPLREALGRTRAQQFVLAAITASLLLQLPLRSLQVESFVRPFARTAAAFRALPAQVVGFDPRHAWYSADLLRNDPFLEDRPLIISLFRLRLTPEAVPALQNAGDAVFVNPEMLSALGLHTTREKNTWDPLGIGRKKAAASTQKAAETSATSHVDR